MELTSGQKAAVCRWVEEGCGLSEVQSRLQEEFGVTMTYMDVRFLLLDLGATIKDKTPPEPAAEELKAPGAPDAAAGGEGDAAFDGAEEPGKGSAGAGLTDAAGDAIAPQPETASKVSVTLDKVMRAGALASGTVTFSDGVTGSWMLDRMGRLALTKVSQPDYQPSDADLEAFQVELQTQLSNVY